MVDAEARSESGSCCEFDVQFSSRDISPSYSCVTGTEDRAPVETDPSAVPRPKRNGRPERSHAPAVSFCSVPLWSACVKFRGSGGRAPGVSDGQLPPTGTFRPGNSRDASNVAPRATAWIASASFRITPTTPFPPRPSPRLFFASYQGRTAGFCTSRNAAKYSQRRASDGPRLVIFSCPLYRPLLRSFKFSPSALR